MLKEAHETNQVELAMDHQAILPIMTALFVDGLGGGRQSLLYSTRQGDKEDQVNRNNRIFRLPLPFQDLSHADFETRSTGTKEFENIIQRGPLAQKDQSKRSSVRPLICGLSHHFNNILMGIWGNATLIRMQLREDDPIFKGVSQMERLIQSGSFLTHTVLGYLGERRNQEKIVRLHQLLSQIKDELPGTDVFDDDPWNFEEGLKRVSRIKSQRMIAGSTARVLEVLFRGADSLCDKIASTPTHCADIDNKLSMIHQLISRGLNLTYQLRLFAEELQQGDTAKIRLVPLMRRVLNRIYDVPKDIRIDLSPAEKLPLVHGDRKKLEWAFEQMIDNAVSAMPHGGNIDITIRTLKQEVEQDRCTVQKGRFYVVITIKDTGCGIPVKIQKRIFEPFFASPKRKNRYGLGLAAVKGVVKAHNGYIQVQSRYRAGSTFKLFIPIAGAAEQELDK